MTGREDDRGEVVGWACYRLHGDEQCHDFGWGEHVCDNVRIRRLLRSQPNNQKHFKNPKLHV